MRRFIKFAILFLWLFLSSSLNANSGTNSPLVIDAVNSKSEWQEDLFTNRKVIFTDKSFVISEIQVDVPKTGEYQLFVYVHHNWRKAVPCIYLEAVDSKGKIHNGYHKIENIWYLDNKFLGRWFFVSLTQDTYWILPKGKMRLKIWVVGNRAPWDKAIVSMEGRVSIDKIFLIPVLTNNTDSFLLWLVNPESGNVRHWRIFDYDPMNATNLVQTDVKNSSFSCKVDIPISGYYRFLLSALSPLGNSLEITIRNKMYTQKNNIRLNSEPTWQLFSTEQLYLHRGTYSIISKNLDPYNIKIDYYMILPTLKNSE